jgi:hypothetical protein
MKNKLIAQKSLQSKVNHIVIQDQVNYIEHIYTKSDVRLNSQHYLFKLLQEVKDNFSEENSEAIMIKALYISRLADGIQCLENVKDRKKYLTDLLNGSLDFLEHKSSHAKSIFFELEVLTHIKSAFPKSHLAEPDIVLRMENADIGIPCKKITSENSLQKVLSKAVKQIENNDFEFGIVAINIDDLLPEHKILTTNLFSNVLEILYKHNEDFIARHDRHFRKYLNDSRIIGVIVTTSIFADVALDTPRFNNAFQWAIWTIPEISETHKKVMTEFRGLVQ